MEWLKNLQKVTEMFGSERWLAAIIGLVFGLIVGSALGITAARRAEIIRTVDALEYGHVYTYKRRSWHCERFDSGADSPDRDESSADNPEVGQFMQRH